MYQYKLYNSNDIENLLADLELYKQTLDSLETNNPSAELLLTKRELSQLKVRFSNIKGDMKTMKENYQEKINGYEKEKQDIFSQIKMINNTLNILRQDVSMINGELEKIRIEELQKTLKISLHKLDTHLDRIIDELDLKKNEIIQLKENLVSKPTIKKDSPKISEFRQIQNLFNTINDYNNQLDNYPQNNSNRKKANHPFYAKQNTPRNNSFQHKQHTNSFNINKESSAIPLEHHKNIITRTTTTKRKNKQNDEKKVEESINSRTNLEKNLPTEVKDYNSTNDTVQDKESNINQTHKNVSADQTSKKSEESTEGEKALNSSSQEDEIKKDDNLNNKSNNKIELTPFFSFFKKRKENNNE
ncbi:hypothetical protein NC661_13310 [Aquibacillus koreensis]|uniref:Uncharacterized protein n=1 Tax=Aquibacillus koreensis TaxID=279446 RepID=A0A9X3WM68_9BACI|nr:hypothetical protein [Aquibacillus koreensis]MCT2536301.1 hypothetical protein [Aquibacillus koreensis]MDC3421348.1 hypothetical protein [Aquibacillus koreensis]